MDFHNLEEFHCAVCFELFGDGSKCPRMLTCGHTFCNSCLENLLVQSPVCPNCKKDIQYTSLDDIPVNYIVKSFLSHLNVNKFDVSIEADSDYKVFQIPEDDYSFITKKDNVTKVLPSEGYCEEHESYKHLRCMDCESWICGVCATLHHKPCQTLLVAEALKEMKYKISQNVDNEIEAQDFQNKSLDKYLRDLVEKRLTLKKEIKIIQVELRNKVQTLKSFGKCLEKLQFLKLEKKIHCNKLKFLESSVKESVNNDQFIKSTNKLNEFVTQARNMVDDLTVPRSLHCLLSIEVLRAWCQDGSVYASHCQNGSYQYGKVDVKEDRVWVHCFHPIRPKLNNVIISFKELLLNFRGTSEFPVRGFLQVEEESLNLGNIVVTMDALTPRALNFILLCSGIKGRSYEGFILKGNAGWVYGRGNGKAVVKGIRNGFLYEAPAEKGFVCGCNTEPKDSSSLFFVLIEDIPNKRCNAKFGVVEEGFGICTKIHTSNKLFTISNCGLVM